MVEGCTCPSGSQTVVPRQTTQNRLYCFSGCHHETPVLMYEAHTLTRILVSVSACPKLLPLFPPWIGGFFDRISYIVTGESKSIDLLNTTIITRTLDCYRTVATGEFRRSTRRGHRRFVSAPRIQQRRLGQRASYASRWSRDRVHRSRNSIDLILNDTTAKPRP